MTGEKQNIYLVCGSGGVGKTTVSASLGIKYALEGKKVIVLTIDPAKRLANALGLKGLTDLPLRIDIKGLKKTKNAVVKNYGASRGELWAMMLDTKRTFDRLVDKYASTKEARDRIFHNKLYQNLSKMMAGTQEYMAMERLYEIFQEKRYDVIIVDTPPMQHANDFLAAPAKMMNVINNSMLHVLLKPTMSLGKTGLKFLEKGSKHILKIFDRVTGFAFMQDLSEMLIAFQGLLTGFQSRASEVDALLKDPLTKFVLICTSTENSYTEANVFSKQLQERQYQLGSIIINRIYPNLTLSAHKLKEIQAGLTKSMGADKALSLIENYKRFLPLIKQDRKWIREIQALVAKEQLQTIPLFLSDVHDLDGLFMMMSEL